VQAPARETGAPALFGYVMDSACVVVWAAEAGRAVPTEPLYDVLTADPDPLAENLFFHLLDRLGVVPL
jgi:hypothetical protein